MKRRNWTVYAAGCRFSMGGEWMTHDEAMAVVRPLSIAMSCRLAVTVECHAPDRRKRDLDNIAKGLLDALTHAGAWGDDEQIDDLRLIRRDTVKGGRVVVRIQDVERVAS